MNPIRSRMLELHMSFTDLQNDTQLSKATIARLIKNDEIPDNTRLSTLKLIANSIECPVSTLLAPAVTNYSILPPTSEKKKVRNEISSIVFSYIVPINFDLITNSTFKIDFFQNIKNQNLNKIIISVEKDLNLAIGGLILGDQQRTLKSILNELIINCHYEMSSFDKNNDIFCDFNAFINSEFSTQGTFSFNYSNTSESHFLHIYF